MVLISMQKEVELCLHKCQMVLGDKIEWSIVSNSGDICIKMAVGV